MSRKPQTPRIADPILGSTVPAMITVEFTPEEMVLHITPQPYKPCTGKEGQTFELQCTLTGHRFTVGYGMLVYSANTHNDYVCGYLDPAFVARGEAAIKERLLFNALLERGSARWKIETAIAMEAAAKLPIQFHLPDVS